MCYETLVTGECPVGTVRCGNQAREGGAHPPPALPSPGPGASNNLPSPSPSPVTLAITPGTSTPGVVQCQRCELNSRGPCQAPNGVCFGYSAPGSSTCPEGTLACALDATADFLDNVGAAAGVTASKRSAPAGDAAGAPACNACVDDTSGPCVAPLGAGASQHICLPFRGSSGRCPAGSVPCAGSSLVAGGEGYSLTTAATPTPSPLPSPAALPRRQSVLAQRGGHPYAQIGYVDATSVGLAARKASRFHFDVTATNASLFTHLVWAYARPVLVPTSSTAYRYGFSVYGAREILSGSEGNPADGDIARWHAHVRSENPAIRTLLGVGGFSAGAGFFSSALSTEAGRGEMAARLLGFARAQGFDGVQVDITYPGAEALGGDAGDDKANFQAFVTELRRLIDGEARGAGVDRLILSVGVSTTPAIIEDAYEQAALSQAVDHLVLHAWDVRGPWESTTGSATPLTDAGKQGLGVSDFVQGWLDAGAERGKLVLGVSAYARAWRLTPDGAAQVSGTYPRVPAAGPAPGGPDSGVPGYLTYWEVQDMVRGGARVHWDGTARTWIAEDGAVYASFENEVSLRGKVDFIRETRIGGYALWAVNTDDFLHGSPLAAALATRITAPASDLFLLDVALAGNSGVGTAGLPPLRRRMRAWAHSWLSLEPPADTDRVVEESRCFEPVLLAGALAAELAVPPTALAVSDITGWRGAGDLNDGVACPKVYTVGLRFVQDVGLPLTTYAGSAQPPDTARISTSIDASGLWVPANPPADGAPDAPPSGAAPVNGSAPGAGGKAGLPSIFDGGVGSGGALGPAAAVPMVDSFSQASTLQRPSSGFFASQPSWLAPFWYTDVARAGNARGLAGAWEDLVAAAAAAQPEGSFTGPTLFVGGGTFAINNVRRVSDNVLTDSTPPSASASKPPSQDTSRLSAGAVAGIVIAVIVVLVVIVLAIVYRSRIAASCGGASSGSHPSRRRTLSGTQRPPAAFMSKWPPTAGTAPSQGSGGGGNSVLTPPVTSQRGSTPSNAPTRSRSISGADGTPRPASVRPAARLGAMGATDAPPRPASRRTAPRRVVAPPSASTGGGAQAPPPVPPPRPK